MAEYDLTSKISSYLDRHLIFPMLEFLTEYKVCLIGTIFIVCDVLFELTQIYDESDVLKSRIELLNKTNMVKIKFWSANTWSIPWIQIHNRVLNKSPVDLPYILH